MSDAPAYGLSWDGHNIYSADQRSIDAVKVALHRAAQIDEYMQDFLNRHEAQAQQIERLEGALISIEEYWNGSENERAMSDALHYIVATASAALARDCETAEKERAKSAQEAK